MSRGMAMRSLTERICRLRRNCVRPWVGRISDCGAKGCIDTLGERWEVKKRGECDGNAPPIEHPRRCMRTVVAAVFIPKDGFIGVSGMVAA